MARLSRPLSRDAVKAADKAFYAKHPELKGKPLSNQPDLEQEWRELYVKYGGKVEEEKIASNKRPDDVIQACVAPKKPGAKILLEGKPEEQKKLEVILDKIRETKSGQKLLSDIDNAKNPITLRLGDAKKSGGGVTDGFTGGLNGLISNGTGSKATVTIDRNLKDDSVYAYDKDGNKIADPVDVIAAHELTHALHCANGTLDATDPERQAINGENAIRRERKPSLTDRDPGNHGGGYN